MTYWLLIWISLSCPPFTPSKIKPIICQPEAHYKTTPFRVEADRVVSDNPTAKRYWCKNLMCREQRIERKEEVYISGRKL